MTVQTYTPGNVLLQDAVNGTIPQETGAEITREFMQNSAVMQLAQYEEMTKPVKKFGYMADAPGAYWVDETERIQTSKPTWLEATMEAKKLAVIIPASKEFLRYTVKDFFNSMKPAISESFHTAFDQAALFGNNSPYAAGTSIWENITTSGNKVTQGTGANLYADLNGLLALVEDGDYDPNGFTTTRRFRKDLRGAVDNNNQPIFNTTNQGTPSQLLGLPVGYVDGKSWDKDKANLLTGDWTKARYGILQGIEFAISQDATLTTIKDQQGNPVNLFERDMFALRATMHVGFMTLGQDAFAALVPPTPVVPGS